MDRRAAEGGRAPRAWSALLRRAFDVDALACPRCGGRMRVMAAITDPSVVRRVLDHLGLASGPVRPDPARPPPASGALTVQERFAV